MRNKKKVKEIPEAYLKEIRETENRLAHDSSKKSVKSDANSYNDEVAYLSEEEKEEEKEQPIEIGIHEKFPANESDSFKETKTITRQQLLNPRTLDSLHKEASENYKSMSSFSYPSDESSTNCKKDTQNNNTSYSYEESEVSVEKKTKEISLLFEESSASSSLGQDSIEDSTFKEKRLNIEEFNDLWIQFNSQNQQDSNTTMLEQKVSSQGIQEDSAEEKKPAAAPNLCTKAFESGIELEKEEDVYDKFERLYKEWTKLNLQNHQKDKGGDNLYSAVETFKADTDSLSVLSQTSKPSEMKNNRKSEDNDSTKFSTESPSRVKNCAVRQFKKEPKKGRQAKKTSCKSEKS